MNRGWPIGSALIVALCGVAVGCDDGNPETDAGMDAGPPPMSDSGVDAGGGGTDLALDGLDGPVEVIVDDRGMPHIYATTINDLAVTNGYLMARDRFIQMEFLRRLATGRLAEVLGTFDATLVDQDRDFRFLGFRRVAQETYDGLEADDPTKLYVDAFVSGINQYITNVVMDEDYQPPDGLLLFNPIRASENFGLWDPVDILALARFQAWNLSYDAGADTGRTERLMGVRAAFPADGVVGGNPADARLADRVGLYADFFTEIQARRVYTRDGFPDGTTHAIRPPLHDRPPVGLLGPANLDVVRRGSAFFDRIDNNRFNYRDEAIGSNSWVVHGDHTMSGNPILSNDPHLSLVAPGVWWYVHLNTAEAGGEGNYDVQGVGFAALPGVVLGYNRNLAWSATTTGYDVTDVYLEQVTFVNNGTAAEPDWEPQSVSFNGSEVALTSVTEVIKIAGGDPENYVIWQVPHHGNIISDTISEPTVASPPPGSTATGSALSVRYTGDYPSNELAFFAGLWTAENVDDALAAQDNFMFGAQNFSFVSSDGDIAWSTQSRIPQREAMACTFAIADNGEIMGVSPLFVLPGQGGFEWTTDLTEDRIPHDINPAAGFIATANQDNVGVTEDGNPCNDMYYIGGGFDTGYREHRIVERLTALTTAGEITTDDMIELQAETRSSLGETMRDPIVAALDHALGDPSDDAALQALVTATGATRMADVMDVRDRLAAWSLATPHGVGASDADEIADSIATTIFNASWIRIANAAFRDEETRIGRGLDSQGRPRTLEWALGDTATQQMFLHTYRADYNGITGWDDTVLWDDLDTDTVTETRDERVLTGVLQALDWLEMQLGTDRAMWRWGRLHAVRFNQVVPAAGDPGIVSIPPVGSTQFPIGFPRHGDWGAVDVGNFSTGSGTSFTHGSGASQRLVVEMTPTGPRPFNALPGGQVEDPTSPHHADEAELWRMNEQPALYYERADVEAHMESTFQIVPAP
ncbi:MAG: penicillin acylase family protein [Sandaracinaceae bacterium]